jgi:threonine/homoserine/homoserine lactone efflux protein
VPTLDTMLAFAAASIVLLLIPGPAVTYIVNRSVTNGRAVALTSVAGVTVGNYVHVIAATVGLSAVLATSATAFNIVKWMGAVYLIGIGIKTLLTRPEALSGVVARTSYRRAFSQGVVVATLNPKVALFFLSFLPQFIDPDLGAAWVQSLILGTMFVLIGAITDSTWALVASAVRGALLRGRAMPFIRRYVSGSIFVGLGVIAARASRSAPT